MDVIDKISVKKGVDPSIWTKLANRKSLKKVIMTRGYEATFKTLKEYFLKEIPYSELSKAEETYGEDIMDIVFRHIYDEINIIGIFKSQDFWDQITENGKKLENLSFIKCMDGSYSNLYFKEKKDQSITSSNKVKHTSVKYILTNEIDIKKCRTSLLVNYVHSRDAELVRNIIYKMPILSVHDCLLVSYRDVSILMYLVQKELERIQKEHIKDKKFMKIECLFAYI
jgi:hypothetical protein